MAEIIKSWLSNYLAPAFKETFIKLKVKQSCYRPGVARRVPGI
jgi:hypothetical protein